MMVTAKVEVTDVALWVEGETVSGTGKRFELKDPVRGETASFYRCADSGQVQRAVDSAQRAFVGWQFVDALHRSAILHAVSESILNHSEELAQIESLTGGKPIRDSRIEAKKCAEIFAHYASVPGQILGQTIPLARPWFAFTERVPLGVLALFTPWNAPLFTACWNMAAALACGNTVVLKPSEYTPHSSLALVRIMEEAGVPPGVVNVVVGDGPETGSALVMASGVSKVAFIGSVPVGRSVAARAASLGVPSVLELGGKSANIVFSDADLEVAARGAVTGLYSNSGQSCTAASRLLVQEDVFGDFLERVSRLVGQLHVGLPMDDETELGPINNRLQFKRIHDSISTGIDRGAVVHGRRDVDPSLPEGGFWVMPTILGSDNKENPIFTNEIFGPVLAVSSFTSESEAVSQANSTGFGLAGAVWTGSTERAIRVSRQLRAGTVWINSYKTLSVAVPFGGFGLSGWGRSSGSDVISEYTHSRATWLSEEKYLGTFPSSHIATD